MDEQTRQRIEAIPLFAGVSAQAMSDIVAACHVHHHSAGEHVLHHQETTSDIFFVLEGQVRVVIYAPNGRDVSFRDLGAGAVFGELAAIDQQPRSASVVAIDNCVLAAFNRDTFMRMVDSQPDVARNLLTHFVGLIRRYSHRVYELSAIGVEERVRAELLRLCYEHLQGEDTAHIDPAPLLADIAARIGTTREAVSREISRLAREGVVTRHGKALTVNSLSALADQVQDAFY